MTFPLPPSQSPADPSHESFVESVFLEWISAVEDGEEADFEELCRQHPRIEADLRGLRSAYELIERVYPHQESVTDRLRPGSGPSATLGPSLEVPPAPPLAREDLLERLRTVGARGSRYKLLDEVARGGMGAILRVWDDELRRTLAMKVVLGRRDATTGATPAVDARRLGRFLAEAQITGQLDHPGIVPVHELGIGADGRVYFTMRLVNGRHLGAVFDDVRAGRDGWSKTRALGVLLKVCEALSYAHSKGVVHRDLKPTNVMVGSFGEVYVMDWGLARVLGREEEHDRHPALRSANDFVRTDRAEDRESTPTSPDVTDDGDVVGTPSYMPPEQADGKLEAIGPRSDVYALGAMLYQLLTGRAPYFDDGGVKPNNSVLLARVRAGPPPSVGELAPETPPELAAICEQSMSRDIARRYIDMQALASDLRAFMEGRVVRAYEAGAWAEARKWVRRHRALAALLVAIPILIGLGTWSLSLIDEVAALHEIHEQARLIAAIERGFVAAFERGFVAASGGEGRLAIDAFQEALDIDAENVFAIAGSALVRLELDQRDKLRALLERSADVVHSRPLLESILELSDPERQVEAGKRLLDESAFDHRDDLDYFLHAELMSALPFQLGRRDRAYRSALYRHAIRLSPRPNPLHFYGLVYSLREEQGLALSLGEPRNLEEGRFLSDAILHHWSDRDSAQLIAATGSMIAGDFDRALMILRPLEKHPIADEIAYWTTLASCLESSGLHHESLMASRRAAELEPNHAAIHFNLGNGLGSVGDTDAAITAYTRALEIDPNHADSLFNLSDCLWDEGRGCESIELLRRAAKVDPFSPLVAYNLGDRLRRSGFPVQAEAPLRRATELDPDFPEPWCNLGALLTQLGRFEEASAAYDHCHELSASREDWSYDSADWAADTKRLADAWPRIAAALESDGADIDFSRDESGRPLSADEIQELAGLARSLRTSQQPQAALRILLDLSPWSELANPGRECRRAAEAATWCGRSAEAREILLGFAEETPSSELWRALGFLDLNSGRFESAVEAFGRILERDPVHAVAHLSLSGALLHLGRMDEALAALEEFGRLASPEQLAAVPTERWLADYRRLADEQRRMAAGEALEDPADAHRWLLRALALNGAGRFGEAVEAYSTAFSLDPAIAELCYRTQEDSAPTDAHSDHRYKAACAAAKAAAGAEEPSRDSWLSRASQWLEQDLDALCAARADGVVTAENLLERLASLLDDPRLEELRERASRGGPGEALWNKVFELVSWRGSLEPN